MGEQGIDEGVKTTEGLKSSPNTLGGIIAHGSKLRLIRSGQPNQFSLRAVLQDQDHPEVSRITNTPVSLDALNKLSSDLLNKEERLPLKSEARRILNEQRNKLNGLMTSAGIEIPEPTRSFGQ